MTHAESFDAFLDQEWPYRSIPKPETFWSLSERWAWSQGKPNSPKETAALDWARKNYARRYGKNPAETRLAPKKKPARKAPKGPKVMPEPEGMLVF